MGRSTSLGKETERWTVCELRLVGRNGSTAKWASSLHAGALQLSVLMYGAAWKKRN